MCSFLTAPLQRFLRVQLSPYVSELALYDIAGTPGVAADVSHINSKAQVKGYAGAQKKDQLKLVICRGRPARLFCWHAWLRF